MLKGVHLTLMIGPAVPVPAPEVVVEALDSVASGYPTALGTDHVQIGG